METKRMVLYNDQKSFCLRTFSREKIQRGKKKRKRREKENQKKILPVFVGKGAYGSGTRSPGVFCNIPCAAVNACTNAS